MIVISFSLLTASWEPLLKVWTSGSFDQSYKSQGVTDDSKETVTSRHSGTGAHMNSQRWWWHAQITHWALSHWMHTRQRDCGTLAPSPFPLSLSMQISDSVCHVLLPCRSRVIGSTDHEWEPLRLWGQIKDPPTRWLPLVSWFFVCFVFTIMESQYRSYDKSLDTDRS